MERISFNISQFDFRENSFLERYEQSRRIFSFTKKIFTIIIKFVTNIVQPLYSSFSYPYTIFKLNLRKKKDHLTFILILAYNAITSFDILPF